MKIKQLFVPVLLAVATGCATVETENLPSADPSRYDNYGKAMKSDPSHPMAYEWQCAHKDEIAAAVKKEVLVAFVASEESAAALLAKVGPAYTTDPIVMTQIGAVTQMVMTPGCQKAAAARKIWVAALEEAEDDAPDAYRKAIFADQLKWCGYAE